MTSQGAPEAGAYWKHLKSGHLVRVLGIGKMQSANWRELIGEQDLPDGCEVGTSVDMREVVIYEHDGNLWARPRGEFEDGRFALATSPSPPLGVSECCRGLAPKAECKCEQDGIADLIARAHEQAKSLGAGYLRANPDGSLELLDPASVYFKIPPVEPSLTEDALDALRKWNEAFEGLFAHCVSNGVFNQWGRRVNCTKLNEAHEASAAVLRKCDKPALPSS